MTLFSIMLCRVSLIAFILSCNLVIVSTRSLQPRTVDAPITTSSPNHISSPLDTSLKTTRTKRNNNHASSAHVARSLLPILDPILPIGANVQVDICIDLSIRLLDVVNVNLVATASLQASIDQHGISAQQLTVVQASVVAKLAEAARSAKTSLECQGACPSATCSANSWNQQATTCTLVPRQLTATSSILASLIANLGPSDPQYCSLCPNRCNSTPTGAPRVIKRAAPAGYCPAGLHACPINPSSLSFGYECLNVQQELDSCGGCASTGEGVDCNKLPGFKRAGCNAGKCIAFECKKGYYLTPANTCVLRAT